MSSGTYLDLAVDGSGQMYVLYYTGDGVAPGDYRVDVYTPAGAALDTNSPGVNVPHLAVDYFRNLYAGNFSPLADIATGQAHIDPALTVPEPSISAFTPELSDRDAQAEAQAEAQVEAQAPAQAQAAQPQVNGRAHRFAPLAAKVGTGDHVQG